LRAGQVMLQIYLITQQQQQQQQKVRSVEHGTSREVHGYFTSFGITTAGVIARHITM
jgi:hypothetical protein